MILRSCLFVGLLALSCQEKTREEAPSTIRSKTAPSRNQTPSIDPEELAKKRAAHLEVAHRGVPLSEAHRVVVLFHGYGADKEDLAELSDVIDAGKHAAFVFPQAPIALDQGGYAWFALDGRGFESAYLLARAFVGKTSSAAPKAGLVVGGFSQGAMLTANLIESLPPQAEAALIFSPADFLPHPPTATTRKIPIFVSHGSRDRILPFAGGQAIHDRFQEAGFQVTWQPFTGPHTISTEVLRGLVGFMKALPAR